MDLHMEKLFRVPTYLDELLESFESFGDFDDEVGDLVIPSSIAAVLFLISGVLTVLGLESMPPSMAEKLKPLADFCFS